MATTNDAILDRVRALLLDDFQLVEAVSTEGFTFQGVGSGDGVFRVKVRGGPVRGGMDFTEERTDYLDFEVIRQMQADYDACRRTLLQDANSLTAAILRDGHQTSGEYSVPDAGRISAIVGQPGASFLTLRLTLPVNYEATV